MEHRDHGARTGVSTLRRCRDEVSVTVLVQVLVWPVGFLSNVFVAPEFMPSWLGALATWNPISATSTAVRDLFGNPAGVTSGWLADYAIIAAIAWPLLITAVFLPLSARAYRRLRK